MSSLGICAVSVYSPVAIVSQQISFMAASLCEVPL